MWFSLLIGCSRVLDVGTEPASTTDREPVCLPGEATGYALPSARWGLAALHAERRLAEQQDSALSQLGAGFFLASAWKISAFGCDDYGTPWTPNATAADDAGCLGISESVVWTELCRLYPGIYTCDAYAGAVSGDQIEGQVMALAWFALAGHALLGRYDLDPDSVYEGATDPLMVPKTMALMHFQTPWYALDEVFADCPGDVVDCLDGDPKRHVEGVAAKLDLLDGATCYAGELTEADVRAYVRGLEAVWPTEDWDAAEAAAVEALATSRFDEDAMGVLDAIDGVVLTRLICPEQELWTWYRLSCP